MLSKEQKEKIKEELLKKAGELMCPMCKHKTFGMADGYFTNAMQTDLQNITLGGQAIPTIGIICTNCGFVSQHAIGVLGLLPKNNETNPDEPAK